MSKKPIISVLMAVYNSEKYLSEAIESILAQTYSDFEFIIINDGSIDRSEAILQEYRKQDERIRVISRGNTGHAAALNEGLIHANGRYVARMDNDDIAFPERFAKQVAFLEEQSDYVAVGSRVLMIDPEGRPIGLANELTSHEEIDAMHLAGSSGAIAHPAVMLRSIALQKIGGYNKKMETAEDVDLFLRLAEVGRLANLPEVLLKYRLHLKSTGHTRRTEQCQAESLAITEAHRRRGLEPPTRLKNAEQQRSIDNIYRTWAWWSLMSGNVETARKHSILAIKSNPLSLDSWKLLACAVRGW